VIGMSFDDEEIDERRREIAQFRAKVFEDLDTELLPRGELTALIQKLAGERRVLPSGREHRFCERTLWSWWSAYKGGLSGLVPASRRSGPRAVAPEILEAAIAARREVPARSTATLISILVAQKLALPGQVKRSTLDRLLEAAGASRRCMKSLGDKVYTRLQFEHPNDFWVGDYHEAPILWVPSKRRWRKVHLGAFLDHFSKLSPHARWYSNERIATLEDSFKRASLTRGLPLKMYVDNGSVYRSTDFAFACDYVDVRLVHSKPYAKEARGLIERFNRTIVDGFEPEARAAHIESLEQLNLLFEAWLEQRYHLVHGSTGQPPLDRFPAQLHPRYPDPVRLQDVFRVRVRRKVHPKTACVEVADAAFQCESFLRGRWVRAHYDPFDLRDVLIYLKGKRVQRAFPQKVNAPQPTPERPVASPLSFDYLGTLRAEYDHRIALQAKHLSLKDLVPDETFTLKPFLELCAELLGKDLSAYEKEELTRSFHGVGPFAEKTARVALEHALRVRGRGLHVSVYSHYLKIFHLAALKANKE
jgi:transposase InsO family protein